jgi:bifunctional non-homologous end joining protein LigD
MPPKPQSRAVPRKPAVPPQRAAPRSARTTIPRETPDVEMTLGGRTVRLTNLDKVFWPQTGTTKGDLLQYYADVAPILVPHLVDRAMVMKRYPNGATGKCFFMKRAPSPRPDWIETCTIDHKSGNVIDFPMVQDVASLLWVVNLGCIDLNPWYATCDDVNRPDVLHFDLDPVRGTTFKQVREAALVVRDGLVRLGMNPIAKTTGSSGIHVYVPIVRGPLQKQVWTFAKAFAQSLASVHPKLLTAEYRIAKRPARHVLVDYNQNAWGRTLASVYSPRPKPNATVSMPVTWDELERGVTIEDFHIGNAVHRIDRVGDLWKPVRLKRGRFPLAQLL